jgi:Leucine-rich repeat (LRR) protein
LQGLDQIVHLRVRDTQLTDAALQSFTGMKKLRILDLSENRSPGITDAAGAALAQLANLEELNLWSTKVSHELVAQLQPLPKLRWLNLDQTQMTDAVLPILGNMTSLAWLHLGSNDITEANIAELEKLPALKYISLTRTKIEEDAFWDLADKLEAKGCFVDGP